MFIAGLVILGLVLGSLHYLKDFTMHGDTIPVPDFTGVPIADLDDFIGEHELRYTIVDSVYSDEHDRGTVVNQNPEPQRAVKKNRKIYLTVNAILPPTVTMRDMVGLSKRQAISMLEAMGLAIDSLVYQPDICLDCVLQQRFKGAEITPGTKLQKGEKVTLVLGGGQEGRVLVPDLRGLTLEQAETVISFNSLVMGAVILCEHCETEADSARAIVYRQIPVFSAASKSVIPMGSPVDVYLTADTTAVSLSTPETQIEP